MRNLWMAGVVAAVGLAMASSVLAMSNKDEVSLADVQMLIDQQKYGMAVDKLQTYLDATPQDANGYNLLGYSYRQLGKYDEAKAAYDRALRLDPGHKGVHEYLGELYLKTGQPAKAEVELETLKGLCGTDCPEYQALAKAIGAAKK